MALERPHPLPPAGGGLVRRRPSTRRRGRSARAGRPSPGGESTLILAPTGTGKTLTAFLWCLDRLMFSPVPARDARCRVLYLSPLKALAVDVERNLRAPLAGIAHLAAAQGVPYHTAVDVDSHRRHPGRRTRALPARSGRHPDHHARVAVPAPHLERPRAAALGRHGDRRRDPRARLDQARRPPGAVARTARAARRAAAAAHRAVGHAAQPRRDRPLPRRHARAASARRRPAGPRRPDAGRGVAARRVRADDRRPDRRPVTVVDAREPKKLADHRRRADRRHGQGRPAGRAAERSGGARRRRCRRSGPRSTRGCSSWCGRTARRCSSSTAGGWPSGSPRRSTSWPARRWSAPTTARWPGRSAPRSKTCSRPGGCARWSPRRRSSWASTWAPSTWWCRSRRRRRWPAACSASAAPATASTRPARA